MDILQIMEQFGVPVAVAMAFGFFIWRQNKFIQETLMTEQKKVQMEQKRLNGVFRAIVEIIARLSGNGLKDKFMRMIEKNE